MTVFTKASKTGWVILCQHSLATYKSASCDMWGMFGLHISQSLQKYSLFEGNVADEKKPRIRQWSWVFIWASNCSHKALSCVWAHFPAAAWILKYKDANRSVQPVSSGAAATCSWSEWRWFTVFITPTFEYFQHHISLWMNLVKWQDALGWCQESQSRPEAAHMVSGFTHVKENQLQSSCFCHVGGSLTVIWPLFYQAFPWNQTIFYKQYLSIIAAWWGMRKLSPLHRYCISSGLSVVLCLSNTMHQLQIVVSLIEITANVFLFFTLEMQWLD